MIEPPPTITALSAEGRGARRIRVEVDGRPWATLDAETVVRERLSTGEPLDAARQAAVRARDERIRARKQAAARAAGSPRTAAELRALLKEKGFDDDAIDGAIADLSATGTIDDTRAVDRIIRNRRSRKLGPRRIEAELAARGIDADAARDAIARQAGDEVWRDECLALARKAAARYQPLSEPSNRRKLSEYLLRRGYPAHLVSDTLRELTRTD